MIILRYLLSVIGKLLLLPTVPFAAVIVSAFTRWQPEMGVYSWGGWYGTSDNPPQGDRGYITKRSLFPNITSGFKGYINRVIWMIRNPLYGYNKTVAVQHDPSYSLRIKGNQNISDKYKIKGWMFATLRDSKNRLKAFEWYSVTPYSKTRNVRIRLGWKIKSDKMPLLGFAQLVFTINPFDGYGND